MLRRGIKLLRSPALILGLAVVIYVSSVVILHWHNWRALELPIDLKIGAITSPEFRVDKKGHYLIELEVERNLPPDDLKCLLGMPHAQDKCSFDPVVDIEWTLTSGTGIVASDSSRNEKDVWWGQTVKRTLGRFDGLPRTPYILEVITLFDGSVLAPANPRIIVQLHWEDSLGERAIAKIMAALSMWIALIGVVWLFFEALCAYFLPGKS